MFEKESIRCFFFQFFQMTYSKFQIEKNGLIRFTEGESIFQMTPVSSFCFEYC